MSRTAQGPPADRRPWLLLWLLALTAQAGGWALTAHAQNPIVTENALTGTPTNQWDITGAGDSTIQGFATDISVNRGGTIRFKINTTATAYKIRIYRLGYYQGKGARVIVTNSPSASLPQSQPDPITDSATGLKDYGNWAESAAWSVPSNAVTGLYIAKLVRTDNGGASHIPFVVRDDAGTNDVLFQTSDTTWQAYNSYGGNSFYGGNGPGGGLSGAGRAYKLSYNRPFNTRAGSADRDWLFNAEYPMIRWLEANGYNVSYTTGVDTDRRGNLLTQHKLFLSVGHDEYWSATQRTNVESALAAGVNLAFFSGNEVFWKTRWESSIDGSNTPYRTLVCYKETHAGAKIDPSPLWTGTWRDPRFSPPADGGRPENRLLGTLFTVNGDRVDAMKVPAVYGPLRFWRNTTVAALAPGATATFPAGTLGYEWDEAPDNGFRPPGLIFLSSTTVTGLGLLQDYGSTFASGTATHHLTLYRDPSGALVFGSGTVQWSWGLDSNHDNEAATTNAAMRQATVNLFADMGVFPGSLQAGLTPASQSTDFTAPTSAILSPLAGATIPSGSAVVVSGTAADGGGRVGGVEVSTDGGTTWHPATGLTNWTYNWLPTQPGAMTLKSRATDDSCNLETPAAGITVTISSGAAGIIGNTNTGTLSDNIWGGGASINAGRFLAGSNLTVTTMRAQVTNILGRYKCAIYSDSGGLPSRLLRATLEVTNAATGWQTFPLTSAQGLTNGSYYWLAIWSDDANARVYYSDTSGTLRWGTYTNYGTWPDPISTSGGNNFKYCIYAFGAAGPTATSLAVTLLEDTTTNLTLLGQGGQGPLTFAILSNPTNGVLGALNPNTGAVSYSPNLNYNGVDTFRFTVSDGSQQATGTVSLTITAVNDAPTLALATNNVVVLEDSGAVTVTSFAVTTNGPANESGQSVTNIAVLSVSNPTLFAAGPALSTGGTLTFTSAANSNGVAAVTVQARDNGGTANGGTNGSGAQSFTITVTAVNDAPVAFDQSVTNAEDTAVAITLTGSDVDGPVTNFNVVGNPAHGQLSGVAPNLSYQPFTNYVGADSFTFRVNDGNLTSAVATVSLTVTAVNDAPVATDMVVETPEDTVTNLMLLGSDAEGAVTFAILAAPTNGVLGVLNTNSGAVSYTPTANFFGSDTFFFTVSDGSLLATGMVSLTVTAVNDAPVATDVVVETPEDTVTNLMLLGSDVEGAVTFAILTAPTNGVLGALNPNSGAVTYTPNTNFFGSDTFFFTVSDGSLLATGMVSLTVTAVNDGPVATDMVVETPEDTVTNLMLLGSDAEGAVTFAILAAPTNGVLGVLNTNSGAVSYTPTANFFGSDTFFFTVSDGSLLATGTVSITVTAVNDAPVANDDNYNMGDGVALNIPASGVLTNDSDAEGDSLTATLVSGPLQGALNLNPDGGFNYTPTNYFNGVDTFTYQVSDSQTNSGPATVNIVVSNQIQIVSIALSNGIVTVTWTSIAGKNYRLQYKESLTDENWTDLAPDVTATGATATGTNAVDSANQRFYRVFCHDD